MFVCPALAQTQINSRSLTPLGLSSPARTSLIAHLKALLNQHRRIFSPLFFLAGFLWDSFTLKRIDAWFDNLILLLYLIALGAMISLYRPNPSSPATVSAPFRGEERIDMATAIKAYTYTYASYEEDLKGSITVGKLADLAVLTQNLFEIPPKEILNTGPIPS